MQLKPQAERLLVRISRAGQLSLSSDTQSYRIALAMQRDGLVIFGNRHEARMAARWTVRLTGLGEQHAARIQDARVDEMNRDLDGFDQVVS